jgi:nucleotide-binding universal stress UspA family protein
MYQKLLIAIDPEDDGEAKRALATAIDLLTEDGELHLASVYSPGGGGFFPYVTEMAPEQKEAEVRAALDLLVHKYLPLNHNGTLHVVAGSAGEKLVGLAGQLCADLLILVSRGSGDFWPLRKATVEYVSLNAPCPVLVLPSLEKAGTQSTDQEGEGTA